MMKFHFSNVDFSSSTGPNTFANRLAKELASMGNSLVGHNDPYDTFIAFIEPATVPRSGCRFIQRLDGIWFKPDQFETHNRLIKHAYDIADHVIWQSEFDRKMSEFHWGSRAGTVIHNGIELCRTHIADPNIQKLREKYDKVFVCSASWHRQKRLQENTELFLLLKKQYPSSCLIVMGSNPDYVIQDPDVYYTELLSHDMCLQLYAAADWMIHLAWLDHCPNVVIEALSQNCPVICTDSGGTKEIVKQNGIIIPESKQYNYELTDYDNPYDLDLNVMDLPEIKVDNAYLDIKKIAQKYIGACQEVM
ncbi:hypothetical protein CL614_09415 [archaeon]|nr:hypothetical protein [archaeon]